ncbi:unnamed protein product [Prunus armeniaca]
MALASQECLGGALDKVGRHVSWAGVWQPRHGSMCSAARKGQRMSTDRGLLRGQLHGLVRGQFGWQIVRMVLAVRAGRLCSWCWQIVQAVGLHDAQCTRAVHGWLDVARSCYMLEIWVVVYLGALVVVYLGALVGGYLIVVAEGWELSRKGVCESFLREASLICGRWLSLVSLSHCVNSEASRFGGEEKTDLGGV